jgi:hypothetical protein
MKRMLSSPDYLDSEAHSWPFGRILALDEVDPNDGSERFRKYSAAQQEGLVIAANFASNYLAVPHAALGRGGPVCPYTPTAIANRTFYLAAAMPSCRTLEAVDLAVGKMQSIFPRLASGRKPEENVEAEKIFCCLLVIFQFLRQDAGEIVTAAQEKAKLNCMTNGYMIGEFYPGCPAPGLHNSLFRPFDMPLPSMGMRYMTEFDIPFVIGRDDYLRAYIAKFGKHGIGRLRGYLSTLEAGESHDRISSVLKDDHPK